RYQALRVTDDTPGIDDLSSELAADARALGHRQIEAAVLHLLGDRFFNRGDFVRAIGALDAAAAALGGDVDPVRLGTIYNSLGRPRPAWRRARSRARRARRRHVGGPAPPRAPAPAAAGRRGAGALPPPPPPPPPGRPRPPGARARPAAPHDRPAHPHPPFSRR